MTEIYNLSRARRRQRAPEFKLPDSLLTIAEVFGFELSRNFTTFSLKRRRIGTEVYIRSGRTTINLSYFSDTYPPSFKAARQWVAAVADRYAWQLSEEPYRTRSLGQGSREKAKAAPKSGP